MCFALRWIRVVSYSKKQREHVKSHSETAVQAWTSTDSRLMPAAAMLLLLFTVFYCVPGIIKAQTTRNRPPISEKHTTWQAYGGSPDDAQYSALDQVNRSNVSKLHKAWSFQTGDGMSYAFNPLVVDGIMYVLAHDNTIVALNAETGKEQWSHPTGAKSRLITNRGIDYWESADRSERRLFFAVENMLQSIDARTGRPIADFGTNGQVDLREGLGRDAKSLTLVQSTTPGRVFEDLLILGSATNEEYDSGPGDIRAYNVRTGRMAWSFHTIPHPGEAGYETWPKDAWKTVGGANAWSGLTLDEKRGIVYVPTASPKYNFYGANRTGSNLFGNCLLAINARTGKLIWFYQMVHHDIWDYDNATSPKLASVLHNDERVDIVAQVTKVGFVWVFNRATGEPLWPIEERPAPKSRMPGEQTWSTQPYPVKPVPFARQKFTVDDLSPYLQPDEQAQLREEILSAHNDGLFTPPSTANTIEMPGNNGGANYGGAAIDPTSGYLYVVSKDLPAMLKLTVPSEVPRTGSAEVRGHALYEANCSICHRANLEGAPPEIPSLVDLRSRLDDDQVRNIVMHGKGAMPAFAKLSKQDVDLIRRHLSQPLSSPTTSSASESASDKGSANPESVHYKSGFGFMESRSGLPVISPPWATMTAYDLNSGEIRWKIPLGDVPELASQGITGTGSVRANVNPVLTAGGLIFAGTHDRKVRAIDSSTGKLLWEMTMDAAVEGMPAIYQVNGRQYIVFCASARSTVPIGTTPGHPMSPESIHGAYVAFSLP